MGQQDPARSFVVLAAFLGENGVETIDLSPKRPLAACENGRLPLIRTELHFAICQTSH
jgi:hypothetical protein